MVQLFMLVYINNFCGIYIFCITMYLAQWAKFSYKKPVFNFKKCDKYKLLHMI